MEEAAFSTAFLSRWHRLGRHETNRHAEAFGVFRQESYTGGRLGKFEVIQIIRFRSEPPVLTYYLTIRPHGCTLHSYLPFGSLFTVQLFGSLNSGHQIGHSLTLVSICRYCKGLLNILEHDVWIACLIDCYSSERMVGHLWINSDQAAIQALGLRRGGSLKRRRESSSRKLQTNVLSAYSVYDHFISLL